MRGAVTPPVALPQTGTRGRILSLLHEEGPRTVGQIATSLHLTPQAIRRHVKCLLDAGWLEVSTARPCPPGGCRGRPQQMYALSDRAKSAFGADMQSFCLGLLRQIEAQFGPGAAGQVVEGQMRDLAGRIRAQWPASASAEERLEHTCRYLQSLGFETAVEREGGQTFLVQRRCPFLLLAHEFQSVCDAEERTLGELLGRPVVCLSRASKRGFGHCRYKLD